jgi:branched-chain amino acid aminotransferase
MILPLRTNHFMERANQYGDLLFETMLFEGNEIRFANFHFERLIKGLEILKMPKPFLSCEEFLEIAKQAAIFGLNQNPIESKLRIRFTAKRNGLGNYLPINPQIIYETSVQPILPKNNKFLTLGIYPEQVKAPGILANLKTGNALIYIMSALYAKENNWDEALILNTFGNIIESTSSNIFWFKNNQWYTPPLSEGCIEGVGRRVFMESHPVIEMPCALSDLQTAEQRLLTNALFLQREFILNP